MKARNGRKGGKTKEGRGGVGGGQAEAALPHIGKYRSVLSETPPPVIS